MQRMKGVEALARINELEALEKDIDRLCSCVMDDVWKNYAKSLTDIAGVDQSLFSFLVSLKRSVDFELARTQKAIYETEVEV